VLDEGGPVLWQQFMAELREAHLGTPARRRKAGEPSVGARLQAAYEAVVARRKTRRAAG
jgi:hypothetical protein